VIQLRLVRAALVSLVVVFLLCFGHIRAGAATSLIQLENNKPGTLDWQLINPGLTSGVIEGYASLTSVNRGGQISLFVNTAEPTYTMDIFRMGYYGSLGGRRMMPTISRTGRTQVIPSPDPTTGIVECNWADPYVLNIPNSADATDWMSGIYLVKLTAGVSKTQGYIIFAVRDDTRFSDLILAQTVNTYQAYNPWGGKSLYGTLANRDDTANKAVKVSFNRPYYGEQTSGAANFFYWEYPMLNWLEGQGYDISYATNVDVDRDPNLLLSHKAFLSVGHDEYWTWSMRDNVEGARDRGINLGFFSGNVSYWQVRYEPSLASGDPARTLVGYKELWPQDPFTPAQFKTNEFRAAPVNRPEDAMIGVDYITQARPVMVVEDASHWVFTGTGLHNGDPLTNADGTPFLGYEVDAMGPASPANTQRLAHSPATPPAAYFADMTTYRAASGATVFAAGSIAWGLSVPQVVQMTRNVLARFTTGAFADTTPIRPPLPAPFQAANIGDVGRPGFVALASAQSFTLDGGGRDLYRSGDALYYVYQPMAGDGQIIVRVNALQNYWDNRAGVMVRESLAPTAKYVALVSRPSLSSGSVNEGAEFWVRATDGTIPQVPAAHDQPMPNWLRLVRSGDTFTASLSPDGTTWTVVGSTVVPMTATVLIGTAVASAQYGVWTTASFDNVTVGSVGSSGPCSVTLDQPSYYAGGPEADWSIGVSSASTCSWTAGSDSAWLVVNGTTPTPPAGNGSVQMQAITNTTGLFRVGHVTINGSVYTVSQESLPGPPPPTPCPSVTLDNPSYYSGGPEADWTIIVTAPTQTCTWTATSDSAWLVVVSTTPAPPAGSGTVEARTVSNTTGQFRVGHLTIGGVVYTVSQESSTLAPPPPGGACSSVTLDRTSYYAGAPDANWTIVVTAPTTTCTWTAVSNSAWLTVNSTTPSPPVGTGSVAVEAATNTTGAFRFGQITIGGTVFTVTQEP
jgi:hypothetical protein